jgi:AcrR family transcriptional regulator
MSRPADPQRRDSILQAATQIFLEKGYSEARLSDIAERAGIVTSTLYLYFNSKEAMVQTIAENFRRTIGGQILPILANLRCREDLENCIEKFMNFAIEYNDLLKLWRLDSGLRGVPIFNIKSVHSPMFIEAMQVLERQMDEGTLNRYDPALLIHLFVSVARWMFENVPLLEDEEERELFRKTCVDWLAHALLPCSAQLIS